MNQQEDLYKLNRLSVVNSDNEETFALPEKLIINPDNLSNYDTMLRFALLERLTVEDPTNLTTVLNADINQYLNIENVVNDSIIITPTTIDLNTVETTTQNFEFNVSSKIPLSSAMNLLNNSKSSNNLMNIDNVIGTARAYLSNITLSKLGKTGDNYNYKVTVTIKAEAGFNYTKGGRPSKSPMLYIGLTTKTIQFTTIKTININIVTE